MSTTTTATQHLWFLDTLVSFPTAHADADGLSAIECRAPYLHGPPLHVHETQDELFVVLDGELRVHVDGDERRLAAGETAVLPKGVPHTFRVESAAGARWLAITTGADFEEFVRALGRPAESDGLPPAGPPTPEQVETLVAVAAEHRIAIVGPPLA